MAEAKSVREVVQDEILSDRTLRYRRNLFALCIVAIAIHVFDFVDFSKLSLFGLEIKDDAGDPETVALTVLWSAIIYNGSFFFYHAYWDWRQWLTHLTVSRTEDGIRSFFPKLTMFRGKEPDDKHCYRLGAERPADGEIDWKYQEKFGYGIWTVHWTSMGDARHSATYLLPTNTIQQTNEKVRYFKLFEVGFPATCLIGALVSLLFNLL